MTGSQTAPGYAGPREPRVLPDSPLEASKTVRLSALPGPKKLERKEEEEEEAQNLALVF